MSAEADTTTPVPRSAWIYPTVVHVVLSFTLFSRLLLAGPGYERTFRDFNMKLPALTELFMPLSRAVSQHGFEVLVALPILWLVDAVVLWLLGGWTRWEGRLWFWVVTILLMLTWLTMEVSFFLPAWKLREALSR
jgi:type II secretory pathway component PulF